MSHNLVHKLGDAYIVLGRSLEVPHVIVSRHLLSVVLANLTILLHVYFVAHEQLRNVLVRVLVYAVQPHFYILERVGIRHVEAEDHPLRLLVETQRQCSKSFLSRCVPYLKFYALVLHVDRLDFKVNT